MKILVLSIVLVMMLAACNVTEKATEKATEKVENEEQLSSEPEMESAKAAAQLYEDEISNPLKNIKLPELSTEWQKAYANYLSDSFFSECYQSECFSAYIEDINKDGIPEIFLYSWVDWTYPQTVLTYSDGEAVETFLGYYTSVPGCCYLYIVPETSQLVVKQTGHTLGTNGMLDYLIYDYTSDGYVLTNDLSGIEDWAIEEYGVNSFLCSINGEAVEYNDFAKAVDELINPLSMIDFAYHNYQKRIFVENIPNIIFSETFESQE